MEWMLMPLRRYAQFSGRSRRKEYWMFVLFVLIGLVICTILDSLLGLGGAIQRYAMVTDTGAAAGVASSGGLLTFLFAVAMLVPSLSVAVRRLHDIDRSGWWLLIGLIPFIGAIVLIVFYATEGTRGPNRFGPDPKTEPAADVPA